MKNVGEWLQKEQVSSAKPKKQFNKKVGNKKPFYKVNNHSASPKPKVANPTGNNRGNLRIYPLGGFEQIGRNCLVIEVDGDIYIIDLGLQFPDEEMLGIDYLIPDISSLK
ncbi:MAG: hypothetical protein KAS32_21170, partial [Candidatus Peribacteraceae bacterium]|nr:hypothetical protein [Candidatus Peribacteraceae bacterium]